MTTGRTETIKAFGWFTKDEIQQAQDTLLREYGVVATARSVGTSWRVGVEFTAPEFSLPARNYIQRLEPSRRHIEKVGRRRA